VNNLKFSHIVKFHDMPGDKILKTDWKELKMSPDACVVRETNNFKTAIFPWG
jgi:hypothetical protein